MPPKKLTKAEKEKLKKEEAERKAAEEEARRLQEEEERRQREEEERRAQEERERLQAIEDARFAKETAALDVWLVHQKDCFDEWKAEQWKEIQWNRYLSCEKLPNPLSESELNTYLQCWEQDVDDVKDVETTFASISEALRLCEEIQCILDDKHLPSVTDKHRELLEEVITRIRTIISAKVDRTTSCVLGEGSEKYLDSESNLKLEHKISNMAFCIWGNLSKNPRLKSFSFNEQDLTIEIPKPLQLADVAVRVVWPPLTQQLDKETVIDAGSDGDTPKQEGDNTDTMEKSSTAVEPVENAESNDQPTETTTTEGDAVESGSIAASDKEASAVQVANEEEEDDTNTGGEDNEEGSTAPSDKPQDDAAAATVEKPLGPVDELDLRAYVPAAGGLIMLELLRLPPQPKCVSGWTIRQVTDNGVLSQPYPVDPNAVLGSATWAAFNISMKLPKDVMVNEDTKLARWDQSARIWRIGGLNDVKIDTESQTVSCMAHHFTPIAIMLDRYTNMPYQTWEMRPLANDHTLYTITGATLEVAIEIKEKQCSLVSATANDSPILRQLLKQWTTFSELKKLLLRAGVNLFPEHDADNYVSIIKKDEQVEMEVYKQMSLLSCVVGFAWSKWSSEVNEQQFVVQACECVDQQSPWELYIAGLRSCKLKMKDDEQFIADVADNHEHHPDIFSTMDKVLTQAAKERMKQTSACHVECIRRWLVSTKPLTYS